MRSSSTSTDAGVGAQRPAHASHTLNNLPEVDAASSYSSSAPIKFAWNQEEGRSALEARRGEMVRGYGRCLPSPISLCPLTRRPPVTPRSTLETPIIRRKMVTTYCVPSGVAEQDILPEQSILPMRLSTRSHDRLNTSE